MIEPKYFWLTVALLSVGTFSIRYSIIAIAGKVTISDRVKQLFSYIPAAILPAFVAPAAFYHQGHVEWAQGKERLMILALAVVVCYIWRSTLLTIVVGLVALYALSTFA